MHGGPGGTHLSNMPYVALSDTYPVILYDQLGSGNSERPGDQKNFPGSLDDPEFKDAVDLFYSRPMCLTNPCSTTSYRDDGPTGNDVMYVTIWGVTDFNSYGTLKDYDISDRLQGINVPSLVICGEFDEARPRTCHRYANMIENATTVIVPDAGHATMAANETIYMQAVRDFLNKALR
jgi:L-proline amide hydrolase